MAFACIPTAMSGDKALLRLLLLTQPSYSELIGLLVSVKISYNYNMNSKIQHFKTKTTNIAIK